MAKFSGRQVDIGVARESTRGDPVAPTFWIPRVDLSFDDKVTKARIQSGVGTRADSEQTHVTTKWADGDIGAEVRDVSIGILLKSMLGTLGSTGPASGAYTHTFTILDSAQSPSMTFTIVDPNETDQYRKVVLTTLELTSELDDVLRFTASFIGMTSKDSSATTDYTAENKFAKQHGVFRVSGSLAGLATASNLGLKSVSLTINQNAEIDDILGSAEPEDFLSKGVSVEGSVTLNKENDTWREYMRNNTTRAMRLQWVNTDATIPGGTTNPSLTFNMPKVDFFDWEENPALDEITSQTISFKASRDLDPDTEANRRMITAVLINSNDGTSY